MLHQARCFDACRYGDACYSGLPSPHESRIARFENCLAVIPDTAGTPGHPALRIIDTQRRKIPRAATVTVSTFRCTDCGTVWRYRDAKDDGPQGWAIVPGNAAPEIL